MQTTQKAIRCALFASIFLLSGCASAPSTFAPGGEAARRILSLTWMMLIVGTVVYIIVMGLMVIAMRRAPERTQGLNTRRFVLIGGFAVPFVILAIVFGFTLTTLNALSPERNRGDITIEVVGYQWWWEVRYPDQGIVTANEIHVPVGEPVNLILTSGDVIHSFWVPELHGKHDLIPGRENTFWIQADEPGEYWGLCTEFCGTQHAKMLYLVVADPNDAFDEWVADQQETAAPPDGAEAQRGFELFFELDCDRCHQIQGTEAEGQLGPDLTHFASRLTLGAGIAPNERDTLAEWVRNPHTLKPGNLMPAIDISDSDLAALVAYLEQLE